MSVSRIYTTTIVLLKLAARSCSLSEKDSPVLAEFGEECLADDTAIVDDLKIKVEREWHAEAGYENEDLSEDNSYVSDKTGVFSGSDMNSFSAIPISTLDT
jgi:hypothetical protein